MSLTIDASVGGAASNAYADVDTAVEVAESRGAAGVAFLDLDGAQQANALMAFAADMDAVCYLGTRSTSTQVMEFPRNGIGYDGVIPPAIARANIEGALVIAPSFAEGATVDALNPEATGNGNVKKTVTGPIEKEFFAPSVVAVGSLDRFPLIVRNLLQRFVRATMANAWGSGTAVRAS